VIPALLLALAITWPPRVEVSSGASCRVVHTSKAAGDCEAEINANPGIARWWRSCGYIEWAGRGPHGEDIDAEISLWAGDSRHKAMGECEKFLTAYEKRMKAR
jgi:hypothetical protein